MRATGPQRTNLGAKWCTAAEAERWAAQLLVGIADRDDAQEVRLRVVNLLGQYLARQEDRTDLERRSVESCASVCKRLAREDRPLREVLVERMDRGVADEYVRVARKQGQALSTINLDLHGLGAAWAWGRREGLVPDRDLELPKLRSEPVRPRYTPTPGEVRAVLDHVAGWPGVALHIQAETGARISEVAALRWEDLDLADDGSGGWAHLGRHVGARKTGARSVPLSAEVCARIRSVLGQPSGGPIFGPTTEHVIRHTQGLLPKAQAELGQPRWTSHGLRRATVRRLLAGGVDIGLAAKLLGHDPAMMMRVYNDPTLGDLAAAGAAMRLPRGKVVDFKSR